MTVREQLFTLCATCLFQGPQPLRLGNVHAAEFGLPIVDRPPRKHRACEPARLSSPQPHCPLIPR